MSRGQLFSDLFIVKSNVFLGRGWFETFTVKLNKITTFLYDLQDK